MALLPRRFLQGCAALLALALSALGGSRIGFDRLVGGDGRVDDQAVIRRADALMEMAAAEIARADDSRQRLPDVLGTDSSSAARPAATAPAAAAPHDCPALLLGSSRGPRAP